jgi:hypothetical protein
MPRTKFPPPRERSFFFYCFFALSSFAAPPRFAPMQINVFARVSDATALDFAHHSALAAFNNTGDYAPFLEILRGWNVALLLLLFLFDTADY